MSIDKVCVTDIFQIISCPLTLSSLLVNKLSRQRPQTPTYTGLCEAQVRILE